MKWIYRIEMRRAFKGKRMAAALGIGMAISICQLAMWLPDNLTLSKYNDMDISGLYHPVTVFYGWIGGITIQWQQYLYFLIIPLLASLPYGASLFDDRKNGYIKSAIIRCGKKDYYCAKWMAVFFSGGCAAVIPLVFNLLVTMMFLSSACPEVTSSVYSVGSRTMFAGVFYSHPFIYLAIYFVIQFIFAGLFACIALVVSDMTEYRFVVDAAPLIVYVFICAVMDLIEKYGWGPNRFLNPSWEEMSVPAVLTEAAVLLAAIAAYIMWKGKKDEVF